MERGLVWLPLLIIFIWLAWSGWNEYQKVEAYGRWAAGFDRAKYDIYAVVGKKGDRLTWGTPTRNGPIDLQTFSLEDVESISLIIDGQTVDLDSVPDHGKKVVLDFRLKNSEQSIQIPFTEIPLATNWGRYLEGLRG
ncbi:hypothetical protein [Merismopedia glauca]|uniref:Uncharacterized protein n=1 Tax=Merismopedia glauca CCAP 1448/3 TaxID=1296344 RepID=A0A2T1BY26_9CYAN|nr:hypothetical protein [Merismopedia glauca]PSB00844.1 hypothetical protein C7B64_21470 [Merismopedia glauca CCAP 1448/3]